jgi:hypothetical protein
MPTPTANTNSRSRKPRTTTPAPVAPVAPAPEGDGWKLPVDKRAKITIVTKPLTDLDDHPRNMEVRDHPEPGSSRWDVMVESLKHDYFDPLVWNKRNGQLVSGHLRKKILRHLGFTKADVVEVNYDEPTHIARLLAANKGIGSDNVEGQKTFLRELAGLGLTGLTGFTLSDVKPLLKPSIGPPTEEQAGSLCRRFTTPPFSVLDTRQGYWQDRRREWLEYTGNLTETKEGVLAEDNMMSEINEGSSNFDPVLAEIMMMWFCPAGGKVLDPFGGEQTKGVVAGELGLTYNACEFRADQVKVNNRATKQYPKVSYVTGDSEQIASKIKGRDFNLCFTSPPYYDLEVYSKDDMSALGTYEEFMAKYQRIFQACVDMLEDNSFVVVKVGEIRDKKTGNYRNFVGDNITMFTHMGLEYYNELILINTFGTAPQRAGKFFKWRKMVKVHQNVLVFCKGDPKLAAEKCGGDEPLDVPLLNHEYVEPR